MPRIRMRVVLFHSDSPDDAAAAGALVRLLSDAGHEVLNIGGVPAMDSLLEACPSARCERMRKGGKGLAGVLGEFAPESVGCLSKDGVWTSLQGSDALKAATILNPADDATSGHRARCEAVVGACLGPSAVQSLRGAWRAMDLGAQAASGRAGVEAVSSDLGQSCASAVSRIAEGLERVSELRELSRLIATLQAAIESQAADNADLQTQLEARGATIRSRDELVASLRSQISGLGLELERMHRLGSDLQEAHKVAGQMRERLELLQSGDNIAIPKVELEELRSKAAQASRLNEIGAELQRVHGVAGDLRSAVSTRDAEIATARAQVEELREQVRNLHGLGAELHRVHSIAGELKTHLEVRTERVAELMRQLDQARVQLETARHERREADLRAAAALASAAAEASRASRAAEEFAATQQSLIQAQARAETIRNDLARARTDRDALDMVITTRDAELAQVRTALVAEQRAREAALASANQARSQAAALSRENITLRERVADLLASRWRKIGQRFGVAMTLPWEKELREVKPGAMSPARHEGPNRAKNA